MKGALPEGAGPATETNGQGNGNGTEVHRTGPVAPWVEKTAYDYADNDDGHEWESTAAIYEWDGDEGEIGPEHPGLEIQLFGKPEERDPSGIDFRRVAQINVLQEGLVRIQPIKSFADAGLHPAIEKSIELCGYRHPTPIQQYCIPAIKMGHDMIAIAQTGSGKTAAYLIPILNHLMGKAKKLAAPRPSVRAFSEGTAQRVRAEPLVVIVCPARELAIQIFNEARKFCYRTMLRPCVVYGGGPLRDQIDSLQRGCDVLVASPGRLVDLMERPDVLSFRRVKYMVIDEADELLDSDWTEEFNKIMTGGEQEEGNIKYMLFSATFPVAVRSLAKTHLAASHVRIRVGRVGKATADVKQEIVYVAPPMKKQALLDLLWSMEPSRTIIFANSKRTVDELDDFLFHKDFPCTSMHSDRTQREREDSMRAFRSGKAPLLITTGVTARGIDVRNVLHVINFDLPSFDHGGIQEYVHRIGRTGRIGHHGLATSFYTDRDEPLANLLTMTLMENNQVVPDFLEQYKPEDGVLKFEYDTDEEEMAANAPGGGGTGGIDPWAPEGGDDNNNNNNTTAGGWPDTSGGATDNNVAKDTWSGPETTGSGWNDSSGGAAGGDPWGSNAGWN
ncbi:P-loop containing nucleoside triphosphate hydrolase protein [Xylariomycetidae sp. FL0641]|nr:P-loop containing nucleoside triphosphate hydrolase protein [Xylariomycetidae sp. FL0641]